MLQKLASASRARDYTNHIESQTSRENGYVEQLLLEENLKKLSGVEAEIQRKTATCLNHILEQHLNDVWAIEAKLPDEEWTVSANVDTIMLSNWLDEASKFQTEVNELISYQDCETRLGDQRMQT